MPELSELFVVISAKADELTRVSARAQRDLQAIGQQADLLGDKFDGAAATTKTLERAIAFMAKKNPAELAKVSAEMRQLVAETDKARQAAATNKVMSGLSGNLDTIAIKAELMGKSYNAAADRADALKDAIVELNRKGLDRNSTEMQQLMGQYRTATVDMKRFDQQAKQVARGQDLIASASRRAKMAIAAGAAAMAAAGVAAAKQGVQAYAAREQRDIAYTGLFGGDQAAGQKALDTLWQKAAATPFDFAPLADLTQRFMGAGVDWQEIPDALTAIGDAAAMTGKGNEAVERISNALIQMLQKGKVSAEEMTVQLGELIPAWPILAEEMGITTAEAQKLAQDGLIPADYAFRALLRGMEKWAPNAMANQIDTLNVKWSGFVDALRGERGLLSDIGEQLIETFNVKDIIDDATKAIQDYQAALEMGGWAGLWQEVVPPWVEPGVTLLAVAMAGKGALSLVSAIQALNAALATGTALSATGALIAVIPAYALVAAASLGTLAYAFDALWEKQQKWSDYDPNKFSQTQSGASAFGAWTTGKINPDSAVLNPPPGFSIPEKLKSEELEKYRELFADPAQFKAFEEYVTGALGVGESAAETFAKAWQKSLRDTAAASRNTSSKMAIDGYRATVIITNQAEERWKALKSVYQDAANSDPFKLKLGGDGSQYNFKLKPELDYSQFESGLDKWLADVHGKGQTTIDATPFQLRLSTFDLEVQAEEFTLKLGSTWQTLHHQADYWTGQMNQDATRNFALMLSTMEQRGDEHSDWAYGHSFWPDLADAEKTYVDRMAAHAGATTWQLFSSMVNNSKIVEPAYKNVGEWLDDLATKADGMRGPFGVMAQGGVEAFQALHDQADTAISAIKSSFLSLLQDIDSGKKTWGDFGTTLADITRKMLNTAEASIIAGKAMAIGDAISKSFITGGASLVAIPAILTQGAAAVALIEGAKSLLPDPVKLAAGGIVRARAGGTLALIGEGGQDEAVIPLDRGSRRAGNGVSIIIQQPTIRRDDDVRWLMDAMFSELRRKGVAI